jgi:WD40 repeat protein
MNRAIKRALLQILPLIITIALFPPVTSWAQATAEPKLEIKESGYSEYVYSLAFSPDGKTLASASGDNTIRLWEIKTGRLVNSFAEHSEPVHSVAFSPDGKTLASGSKDRTIKLWDVRAGKLIRTIFNGEIGKSYGEVYSVAFSPNGKTLASASTASGEDDKSTLKLWDVNTGHVIRFFEERKYSCYTVTFSPDGKMIASGGNEGTTKLWEVGTGNLIHSFVGRQLTIRSVAFSPDGKTLASAGVENVNFWDVGAGKLIRSFNGKPREGSFSAVAFSPDGNTLAAGNFDGTVKLLDVSDGSLIHSFEGHNYRLFGRQRFYHVHSVAFSPHGKMIASGDGATIKVWSVGAKSVLGTLKHYRDGGWIAFIPGNYYVSSEGAAQYISWSVGNKDYDETQFRSRFYQPDIVAAGLSGKEVSNLISPVTTESDKPNAPGAGSAVTESAKPPIKDTTAPKIVITSPYVTRGVGVQSTADKMKVMGQALDDSGVKTVLVQGAAARLDAGGNFSGEATLKIGDNLITVTATDVHGNQASESFVVRRVPVAGPVTAAGTAGRGRYHALLIAVQEYDHPGVNRLEYPVSDAQQVGRELTSRYTFEPQDVTTLKNPDRLTILDALDQMTEKLKPEDNLLIFYAGHGVWDKQRNQGYWLPRDAARDRRANWISNGDLRDAIRGIKARHILLISDACFAGGIFLTREAFGPMSSAVAELDKLPSRTAMTSGALTTVPDRSVFVEYLLKRLSENTEDALPALELFSKLRLPVIHNSPAQRDGSRPTPRYGTIFEVGDEGGDFIFVRRR